MLCICAHVRFPMPAALAFLTVGFGDSSKYGFTPAFRKGHLRNIQEFPQGIEIQLGIHQQ